MRLSSTSNVRYVVDRAFKADTMRALQDTNQIQTNIAKRLEKEIQIVILETHRLLAKQSDLLIYGAKYSCDYIECRVPGSQCKQPSLNLTQQVYGQMRDLLAVRQTR